MFNSWVVRVTLVLGTTLLIGAFVVAYYLPQYGVMILVGAVILVALMLIITQTYWAYYLFRMDERNMRHQMTKCPHCEAPIYKEDAVCPYCNTTIRER